MNYQTHNWQGYQMQSYNFNPNAIIQYAAQIFQQFDRDRSGMLEMHEFPMMCASFFNQMGMAPPSYNDINFLMYHFDRDRNGRIDFNEFRGMLNYLGGQR